MVRILFLLSFLLLAPFAVMACEDDAAHADAHPLPVSKVGNVTGGHCKTDADCAQGCLTGDSSRRILCITKAEGNSQCIGPNGPPPGGLECGCLTDVKHCGYAAPGKS